MPSAHQPALSAAGRRVVLAAVFLGWLCAGVEMGLTPLVSRSALRDLLFSAGQSAGASLSPADEAVVGQWFGAYLSTFLLGGAAGGVLFGRWADASGRVRAVGWSILCYSLLTGAGWFAQTPGQLLVLRLLASFGIGGMWAAGVPLASEAWPDGSRTTVAGAIGAAANIGILLLALLGAQQSITPQSWRWVMLVGAAPALLGMWVLWCVPESPRWLAVRGTRGAEAAGASFAPLKELFRPPLRRRTLLGVGLATVPLLGTWASGKWLIPWADATRGASQAQTQAVWAAGAVIGSALGGWLAERFGRRTTYFVVSAASLVINVLLYHYLVPSDTLFLPAVFLVGLVPTIFFGWLPLCLPELFPTRVRATGSGVTFNLGRVVSACGVLVSGWLMTQFHGDYASVGELTAGVYAVGMVLILAAREIRPTALDG
jgi:MFS family permease